MKPTDPITRKRKIDMAESTILSDTVRDGIAKVAESNQILPETICDSCGKSMRNPLTGTAYIGMCISRNSVKPPEDEQFVEEQFGRFTKPTYFFCYECWLDSMGAKPS